MSYSGTALDVTELTSVSEPLKTREDRPSGVLVEAPEARCGFPLTAAAQFRRPTGPESVRRESPLRLHDVLEKEAKRMAQSLHDEAGQLLAAVHLKLDELTWSLPDGQRDPIRQLKSMLDQLEGGLRRLSHELRPMILDDLGLLPAVEFLRQGVTKRTGLSIELKGSTAGRLPARIETALYRIVHEALGNIVKHAGASRVKVAFLRDAEQIQCSVCDDGIDLDVGEVLAAKSGRGLGLLAIRERLEDLSGTLSIRGVRGQGTELVAAIPLDC
jgi:signal transduction histidine kinase